jgi:hypothetical protein
MGAAAIVLLRIDSTGTLVPPLPGRAEPDSAVGFVMANDHPTDDFKVEIDFDDIVAKQDKGTKRNPFKKGGPRFHRLSPREIDLIDQETRPLAQFGSGAGLLPFTTYKYSVTVTNVTSGGTVIVDPDFDIPPP